MIKKIGPNMMENPNAHNSARFDKSASVSVTVVMSDVLNFSIKLILQEIWSAFLFENEIYFS